MFSYYNDAYKRKYILLNKWIYLWAFCRFFTWLVYLFFMISSFGMCSGYLERFQNGTVNLELFYKKRYSKIIPFFGVLILIALVIEPSLTNLYEASIELLLLHGLLPNNAMNVLGVCWTLGVIFLFYLLFPAFSVLMKTKIRAWISLGLSFWLNFICENYFFKEKYVTKLFTPRHSFIYCIPLFIGGGIVYLYRENIRKICSQFKWFMLFICMGITMIYYIIPSNIASVEINFYVLFIIFMFWLSYAISVDNKVLSSKIMKYLSSISLEMYLAQMVIFRILEKLHLLYILGNGWTGYILSCVVTIIGLVAFIECYKLMGKFIKKYWNIKKNR